jgi:Tfp pilus assembly pilus retraction ATPase PilT
MWVGMLELREVLGYVVRKEGADLHLNVSSRPLARIHGRLEPIEEYEPLQPQDTERLLREMLVEHPDKLVESSASTRRTSRSPWTGWPDPGSTLSGSAVGSRSRRG